MEMTICKECKYESITYNAKKCHKCGGDLEIIAAEAQYLAKDNNSQGEKNG